MNAKMLIETTLILKLGDRVVRSYPIITTMTEARDFPMFDFDRVFVALSQNHIKEIGKVENWDKMLWWRGAEIECPHCKGKTPAMERECRHCRQDTWTERRNPGDHLRGHN